MLGHRNIQHRCPKLFRALDKRAGKICIVVGNADYQFYSPKLPELPDACIEAVKFRASLLALHWRPDHIYPVVPAPSKGEAEDDAVRGAVCNLTNKQLSGGMKRFVTMLANNTNNPYGLIYYAGHGAESADEVYAFGVDANVDLDKEVSLILQYPNYEPFSQSSDPDGEVGEAVDVTNIIKAINGPKGKALLVFFDACRNNPLIDNGAPIPNPLPANLTPDQKRRLSIGSVVYQPDTYDSSFRNIIMDFAGRPKKTVQSGTAADPNWYSVNLREFIGQSANREAPAAELVGDFEGFAKESQSPLEVYIQQIPQHIGTIRSSPRFCLSGCAERVSLWPNEQTEIIQGAGTAVTHSAALLMPESAIRDQRGASRSKPKSGFHLAAYAAAPAMPLVAGSMPSVSNRVIRKLNLDVFYCKGDSGDDARKQAARQFADGSRGAVVAGADEDVELDQIRLRSLDVNENAASGHPNQTNLLVLPRSEATWKSWRDQLGSSFQKSYADDVTKGFIRAYFCTGSGTRPVPTVYPQVAHRSQTKHAFDLISEIAIQLHDLRFEDVEPVDDTHSGGEHVPDHNEVRYYNPAQRDQANAVALALSARTSQKFIVKKRPMLGKDQVKNPTIEVWFGLLELASWS